MCGIVGYVGDKPALDVVVEGLKRLEYRGYDSAGVAIRDEAGALTVVRRAGKLANLQHALGETDPETLTGTLGISQQRLDQGGLTITTTLDPGIQKAGDAAVVATLPATDPRAAIYDVVEPGTGRVLAMSVNRTFGLDESDRIRTETVCRKGKYCRCFAGSA